MSLNFNLISEFQTIHRRSFELNERAILKPSNVRPLVDGEFLQHDAAYKMARGGDNVETIPGTPDNEAAVPSFAWFAEKGRYETQAIGKGPLLYLGDYEADTVIMNATGLTLGEAVSVWDIDIGGIVRRGLAALSAGYRVGYVTRLPATNNGYVRFIRSV